MARPTINKQSPFAYHPLLRLWLGLAGLNGAVAVAAAAYAAHGIHGENAAHAIDLTRTAAQLQLAHAGVLLLDGIIAGLVPNHWPRRFVTAAAGFHAAGMMLFAAALYSLAADGPHWLGALAPLGGTGLILGWLMLAAAALCWKPAGRSS